MIRTLQEFENRHGECLGSRLAIYCTLAIHDFSFHFLKKYFAYCRFYSSEKAESCTLCTVNGTHFGAWMTVFDTSEATSNENESMEIECSADKLLTQSSKN